MLDIDRDPCLALARALQLDFSLLADLIDGKRNASDQVAMAVAYAINTEQKLWMAEGRAPVRLVALKVWWLKESRKPRLTAPEPPPRQTRGGCPNCD